MPPVFREFAYALVLCVMYAAVLLLLFDRSFFFG
jgi:hypothetical protein